MNEVQSLLLLAAGLLVFAGAFIFLAGAIGFLRLPDFYTRMHAPTKAATLGLPLMALASTLINLDAGYKAWTEDLLLVIFVLITVPVSTQILLWAAIKRRVVCDPDTVGRPLEGAEGGDAAADAEDAGRTD